jgi:hypothetical protein
MPTDRNPILIAGMTFVTVVAMLWALTVREALPELWPN